jgi:hypothetical protein
MALRFMQGSDFFEGVDAMLLRKDNAPAWSPATLPEVTDGMVSAYFEPLEDTHELKLEVPPWMVKAGETGPVPWLSFQDRLLRDTMLQQGEKLIKSGSYVDYIDTYSALDQHAVRTSAAASCIDLPTLSLASPFLPSLFALGCCCLHTPCAASTFHPLPSMRWRLSPLQLETFP